MFRNRIFPCLLIDNKKLVKTIKFKNPKYVGDPINAVKIFSDKEVDEIVLLDITATNQNRVPNLDIIQEVVEESLMPISYGGGITDKELAKEIIQRGCEKIIINSYVFKNPKFITDLSKTFGSQSVVVSIDVKKNLFGKYKIYSNSGKVETSEDINKYPKFIQNMGAGEIFLNSIDIDGTWEGYDLELIKLVCDQTNIPVTVCGGASKIKDFMLAIKNGANGCSAGSLAVFQGKDLGVLINFPTKEIKENWNDLRKMYL